MSKNTKRWLKMIVILIVSGAIGFFSSTGITTLFDTLFGEDHGSIGMAQLSGGIFFLIMAGAVAQVGIFIYCSSCRRKVKADGYSNEENSVYEQIENKMGRVQGFGTAIAVGLMPMLVPIALTTSKDTLTSFCVAFATWGFIIFINMINEVQSISMIGKIDPEKDVDWTKMKLNENFYEKMDECEKEKIGMIGAKLVTRIHIVFSVAFVISAVLALQMDFSGFEFVIISGLWAYFTLFITMNSTKKTKAKKTKMKIE